MQREFRVPQPLLTLVIACVSWWGSSVAPTHGCTPIRRRVISPRSSKLEHVFDNPVLRQYLPVDKLARTCIGPITRSTYNHLLGHRAGGHKVGRCFGGHSRQHRRELFRSPVLIDPYAAPGRQLVSVDGYANHLYPSLVHDVDIDSCQKT